MRKSCLFIILLHVFVCSNIFAASTYDYEYVLCGDVICRCNITTYEATVLNFYSYSDNITIPSRFMYDGDVYIVSCISYRSFDTSMYNATGAGMLFGLLVGMSAIDQVGESEKILDDLGISSDFDFDRARSRIKSLKIPPTIQEIEYGAFNGMNRLEEVVIPENVELSRHCFNSSNTRLRRVSILGEPRSYTFLGDTIQPKGDSYIELLAEWLGTPKNTKIYFPKWEEWQKERMYAYVADYQMKIKDANERLQKECTSCNKQLCDYPYSYGKQFDTIVPILIPNKESSINSEEDYYNACDNLITAENDIKQKLAQSLQDKQQAAYDAFVKQPDQFIETYRKGHPEEMAWVDSLYFEYRCSVTMQTIFSYVVEKKSIPAIWKPCRETQYEKNDNLYASQEEFNLWYDKGEQALNADIEQRNTLQELSLWVQENASFNIQKDASAERVLEQRYLMELRGTPYYGAALNMLLFNKRFGNEVQKNGALFDSLDELYQAYISPDYRQIVRDKKKAKFAERWATEVTKRM